MAETIQSRSQLAASVCQARREVEARLAEFPGDEVLGSVKAQLEFITGGLEKGRAPTQRERDRIIIGVQALREFDDAEPDFALLLMRIDSAFRHWERLSA